MSPPKAATIADYRLCFVDFEASALPGPGSVPVEVAVAHLDGEVRSWLIRPTPDWLRRGTWDPQAELLHGIGQDQLLTEGQDPGTVIAELDAASRGYTLLSDIPGADQAWLDALLAASGSRRTWRIGSAIDVSSLLIMTKRPSITQTAAEALYAEASATAGARFPQEHRAGPDARRMAEIVRLLIGIAT